MNIQFPGEIAEVDDQSNETQQGEPRRPQLNLAPFIVPRHPISIRELCHLIIRYKTLANSYIQSLVHTLDIDVGLSNLTIVLRLPHQAQPFDIKLRLPIESSEELFWLYVDPSIVSFIPHSPSMTQEKREVVFDIKPTLLFFHRALELFLEKSGPMEHMDGYVFCSLVIDVLQTKVFPEEAFPKQAEEASRLRQNITDNFCPQVRYFLPPQNKILSTRGSS
ncbi:hypothetical protein CTheo_1828 [Ceratobasidium theobromae]|uniref:Uncharacterized protein n=1 Tax=Ceratobasidium theobromae TaxID=1582974 RepID=A0A5N5QSY1_9AGAM|nr:hypothetical protein CTheo_1828 [Ceratobasidium theobromae]